MATDEQWETWHAFHRMRRRLDRALDGRLQRDYGISAAEYEVLVGLDHAPDRRLRARDLALVMGWEKSRLSHQLTRMERRGFVRRVACETDARGLWVEVTADGRRTLLQAMRGHNAALDRFFFELIDSADADVLRRVSDRVTSAIGCEVVDDTECDAEAARTTPAQDADRALATV